MCLGDGGPYVLTMNFLSEGIYSLFDGAKAGSLDNITLPALTTFVQVQRFAVVGCDLFRGVGSWEASLSEFELGSNPLSLPLEVVPFSSGTPCRSLAAC
jgi:hypothetical protein